MSTFGKIMTVLTFLFSLTLGAICVLLYSVRVNYSVVATKWQQRAELAEASEKSLKEENANYRKREDDFNDGMGKMAGVNAADPLELKFTKLKTVMNTNDQQIKSMQRDLLERDDSLKVEKKKTAEFNGIILAHQLESSQTLADKNKMKQQLKAAYDDVAKLQIAMNKANDEKVKFEIEAIALRETNKQLESRGQDLAIELARTKKALLTGSAGTGVVALSLKAPNPPAHAIDGKVLDAGDGLVEISVGSDAGLVKGHTLETYRLGPKPQYLCMIRLITVEPTRSVGQVVGKATAAPQRGDNVSSKLIRAD